MSEPDSSLLSVESVLDVSRETLSTCLSETGVLDACPPPERCGSDSDGRLTECLADESTGRLPRELEVLSLLSDLLSVFLMALFSESLECVLCESGRWRLSTEFDNESLLACDCLAELLPVLP